MRINQFYESMLLRFKPYRTEWQGQNDQVIVLKLWDKEKDVENKCIRCLSPQRPETRNKGPKWDRRQAAVQEIHDGRKLGFFTIGFEGAGKQKTYTKFRTDGSLWVHFNEQLVSPEEIRSLSSY